jgi:hypothetical protein
MARASPAVKRKTPGRIAAHGRGMFGAVGFTGGKGVLNQNLMESPDRKPTSESCRFCPSAQPQDGLSFPPQAGAVSFGALASGRVFAMGVLRTLASFKLCQSKSPERRK